MSKNNKNKEKDSKDVDKNPTEEKDSKDVDKNPTEEKDSKDGDKKSAAMKESNRKEVDKPFFQGHGMWILVAVLVVVIAVLLSYPPASTDCSALKDEIDNIKKQLVNVSKQLGNKKGGNGVLTDDENKGSVWDRLNKIESDLKGHIANKNDDSLSNHVPVNFEEKINSTIKELNASFHNEFTEVHANFTVLVEEHNQTKKLCNGLSPNLTVLSKRSEELNRKYDDLSNTVTRFEEQLEKVDKNISGIEKKMHENITGLASDFNQTKELFNNLSINVTTLKTGLDNLEDYVKSNLTGKHEALVERVDKQFGILNDNISTIMSNLSTINGSVNELVTNVSRLNTSVVDLSENFTVELINTSITLDTEIKEVQNNSSANHTLVMGKFEEFMIKSKDLRDDLKKVDFATEEIKTLLNDTVDVTSLLRSHALDKTNVLAVVALFFFMLIALAFWIYHLQNKINNIVGTTKMTRNETVHKLSRSSRPENAICLISFNKSQATFQENLINVGLQGLEVPVMYNVISCHSQLTELPHCKLYVVCTEFNERHVIIEQEGVGLGDLKRTTHDAVQKLSGNMIIIYTHDPGSRSLPQGHLYNHNIYCVKSQPELVELRDANRFYSIYNKFTDYQIIQFSNTVRDSLNLR